MKTRILASALFAYFAFTATPLKANAMDLSVAGISGSENPVSAPGQGLTEIQTLDINALLEDWYYDRAVWEQTGENLNTESSQANSTILEDWVSGLESWEQEKETTINEPVQTGSFNLDQWITGIEAWEQE